MNTLGLEQSFKDLIADFPGMGIEPIVDGYQVISHEHFFDVVAAIWWSDSDHIVDRLLGEGSVRTWNLIIQTPYHPEYEDLCEVMQDWAVTVGLKEKPVAEGHMFVGKTFWGGLGHPLLHRSHRAAASTYNTLPVCKAMQKEFEELVQSHGGETHSYVMRTNWIDDFGPMAPLASLEFVVGGWNLFVPKQISGMKEKQVREKSIQEDLVDWGLSKGGKLSEGNIIGFGPSVVLRYRGSLK